MDGTKMDKKRLMQIIYDYETGKLSYRSLAKKYGMSSSTLHRMINSKERKELKEKETARVVVSGEEVMSEDIKVLQDELRKARIKISLQDLVIDIAGKELGIDLRKKPGTRQS